ncbi:MAG: phage portal protein [Pseudomonadota bacterium]
MAALDFLGRMFGRTGNSAYQAARVGRRTMSWRPTRSGPNSSLGPALEELRAKSRDQIRENPTARAASEAFVSNLIGKGLTPLSKASDEALRDQIADLWEEWSVVADADGVLDFAGLEALIARAWFDGGEVFVRTRVRRLEDGLPVPLQVQVIEGEVCPVDKNEALANGNTIKQGIEFDRLGRRVAYHFYDRHPHDIFGVETSITSSALTRRIPARDVKHIFLPLRPGQIRGEPRLTQALIKLRDLDEYDDAELVRKKSVSKLIGFIKRVSEEFTQVGQAEDGYYDENGVEANVQTVEPGTLVPLEDGEDVTLQQPPDVGGMYEVFVRQQVRMVAMSAGVLYEQITGDYFTINDRTYRAAHNEMRRRMEMLQNQVMIAQFCRPVWQEFLGSAEMSGALALPTERAARRDAMRVRWVPHAWRYIHPVQEVDAEIKQVRAGFKSVDDVIVEQGGDPRRVESSIEAWNERADQGGRKSEADPRAGAGGSTPEGREEQPPAGQENSDA